MRSYRVAVLNWSNGDGIARVLGNELLGLEQHPVHFLLGESLPSDLDVVLSYGPMGKFLQIPQQISSAPIKRRPAYVHWSTEGMPDHRLNLTLMRLVGDYRSRLGRMAHSDRQLLRLLAETMPASWLDQYLHRFRYVGDYDYAHRRGWLTSFFDISAIHTGLYRRLGIPAICAPWGSTPDWYADLELERDIDVLWLGKLRNRRRSQLLNEVRGQLAHHGVRLHVVDNVENPFIYGEARTHLLNRTKIVLNLLTTTWDNVFCFRFPLAASNRSLLVSELQRPHDSRWAPGEHYVSAERENLVETILHYLTHDAERQRIVDNAYQLITTQHTLRNSLEKIMQVVDCRLNGARNAL